MTLACVGLGANLGDRRATLLSARDALARSPGLSVLGMARIYETEPMGVLDQPRFYNSALRVRSALAPHALLDRLLEVERAHGRDRTKETRYGPRTLDLDLLYVEGVALDTERLVVPHPRLRERAFALVPMLEIMPEARETFARYLEGMARPDPIGD